MRVSLSTLARCTCSIRQSENVLRMTPSSMSLRTPAARSDARNRSLPLGRSTRRSLVGPRADGIEASDVVRSLNMRRRTRFLPIANADWDECP